MQTTRETNTFANLTGAKRFTGARSATAFLAPEAQRHQGCSRNSAHVAVEADGVSLGWGARRPALGPAPSVAVWRHGREVSSVSLACQWDSNAHLAGVPEG